MKAAMTTEMKRESWATERGAALAAKRAARLAEREAEAAAEGGRQRLGADILYRRFAAVVTQVVEAIDAFARAAEIEVDAEPATPQSLSLATPGDSGDALRLTLDLDTGALVAVFRSRSQSETRHIDLTDKEFSAEPAARAICTEYLRRVEAAQENLY